MRSIFLSMGLLLGLSGAVAAQVIGPADDRALTAPPLMRAAGAERPIALESAQVEVEVNGGLAQTTVELVFRNPNARPLEGQLQFPLRDGQQISAFALDIDGRMRDAVPVLKAKAQAVFEAIERRRVDPALLEKTEGNHFRLRVYPIPAQGTRRVRLSYVETLSPDGDGRRMRLPLAYAREVEQVALRVIARQAPTVERGFGELAFRRDRDGAYVAQVPRARMLQGQGQGLGLRFDGTRAAQAYVQSVDDRQYFVAEVPVPSQPAQRALPKVVGLLWDSSASGRKRDQAGELAVLERYFAALGDAQVRLIRLRDRAEGPVAYPVRGGDWRELRAALKATVYDGATDPGGWTPQADVEEYLLVSDGLFNYGQRRFPELQRAQRLYAINSAGDAADSARLSALAETHGGRLIAWHTAAEVASAADALLAAPLRLDELDAVGATDLVAESPYPRDGVLRIAGRLSSPQAELSLRLSGQAPIRLRVDGDGPRSAYAARLWAGYSVRALGAEPELHRARIARLSRDFGLVTPESSLLVLEAVADYVQHDIAPPAEYRAEFARLKAEQGQQRERDRRNHLDAVATQFDEQVQWWSKAWPKGRPPQPERIAKGLVQAAPAADGYAYMPPLPPAPAPAPTDAAPEIGEPLAVAEESAALDRIAVTGARLREAAPAAGGVPQPMAAEADRGEGRGVSIALQAWKPDSPYAARLRKASPDQAYAIYLDERDGYAASTAFYLDVADVLLEKQQRALALRVLSNLAELDLENRHILRVLGYRLLQADEPALALPLFERVARLAEEEPQSYRDLGLAHAALREYQPAIDQLYEVVSRPWDARFEGVTLIALHELNAIAAQAGGTLDTSRIDPRLLRNLPLDLRAVLSWDSDNSDMDLWVTDPNGERCFYQHPLTYQGGRLSNDFTGGYGPEEFMLRDAKPGKYKVEANFYGDRQQLVTGATTLQLWLSTGFGTARQRDQRVTLRLKQQSETVLVGEFEVK